MAEKHDRQFGCSARMSPLKLCTSRIAARSPPGPSRPSLAGVAVPLVEARAAVPAVVVGVHGEAGVDEILGERA